MADCVMPTRIARNGTVMTSQEGCPLKTLSMLRILLAWIQTAIVIPVQTIQKLILDIYST